MSRCAVTKFRLTEPVARRKLQACYLPPPPP